MSTPKEYRITLGNEELIVRTCDLAQQCNGSAVVHMGGTVCLATCTVSKPREGVDFLPLQVVYQEKYYAGGKVAGSRFRKREGRPADDFILMGRMIDRGLRPMFPKHLRNDIQVMSTVLSYDFEHEHDVLSANAASIAVAISDCPCDGPIASVRVGIIGGELALNPSREARERLELDLFLTASPDQPDSGLAGRVVMIEAAGNEVPEAEVQRAIEFGKKWAQKIARFIADIQKELGKPKFDTPPCEMREDILAHVRTSALPIIKKAIRDPLAKLERQGIFAKLKEEAGEQLKAALGNGTLNVGSEEEREAILGMAKDFMDKVIKAEVRRSILEDGVRMSGRKVDEIRPLDIRIDVLPNRVHGSALFQRGETQAVTTVTLGAPGDKLLIEGMEGEEKRRYFHHYNFPPFSVGETSNRLFVGNREIGHGSLAQRGIEPVLPREEDFPYTIRTVTEILQSNGSSSMAASCGCTLALMAAGVPIRSPVAGIALGLMSDEAAGKYVILTDLQDEEDFGGDMDFKVTGTAKGITAIQMDIKLKGLPDAVFADALERARTGRLQVLEAMLRVIGEPRKELSPYAPRIETIQINPDDIRLVIGKGGETIQKITGDLGVEIDIEDSGMIFVTALSGEAMAKAKEWILGIVAKPEVGKTYDAKVVRIIPGVGAIVEFLRGKDGMIHISELQWKRTEQVEDVVKLGQELKAKVVEYDPLEGKTRLSLKQMTVPPEGHVSPPPRHGPGGPHRGGRSHSGFHR